jgi:predicted nucleic-acid-binding protein
VVDKLLHTRELVIEDFDAVWKALQAYRTNLAGFSDALIGRVNRFHGCSGTATFDRKAARLGDFFAA